MSCIEPRQEPSKSVVRVHLTRVALVATALLAACSSPEPRAPQQPPAAGTRPTPAPSATTPQQSPAQTARNWEQFRVAAARRMVAANAGRTFDGTPPDVLLAIPVLEVELNADGSVRNIEVMRYPRQARDTVQLAMEAIRRGAPYGDVSRLPKPWRYTETFLFNDDRKFKPRSLDR